MKNLKILNKSEFADLICYERERSERTNSPFSLIHMDFKKNNGNTNPQAFKEFINIIAPEFRTLDRPGWTKNNTICILLPETNIDGAKNAAVKLKNKLKERIGKKFSSLDFAISTYPEHFECKEKKIHSKETKRRSSSSPEIYTMEYASNPLMSDLITLDSSCILDLGSMDFRENCQFVMKRLIDIAGALFGLIIFFPIMLIIAAAIKLTSKGPLFFQQERMGYQGKKFNFLKFRSMHTNNDVNLHREFVKKHIEGRHNEINMGTEDQPCYKMKNDPRVTPLGKTASVFQCPNGTDEFSRASTAHTL